MSGIESVNRLCSECIAEGKQTPMFDNKGEVHVHNIREREELSKRLASLSGISHYGLGRSDNKGNFGNFNELCHCGEKLRLINGKYECPIKLDKELMEALSSKKREIKEHEFGDKYFKAVISPEGLRIINGSNDIFVGTWEGYKFKNLKKAMEELEKHG